MSSSSPAAGVLVLVLVRVFAGFKNGLTLCANRPTPTCIAFQSSPGSAAGVARGAGAGGG